LVLFKDIEANGGFQQLNEGVIKRKSGKCRQRTRAFDSGKEILLGINTQTRMTE
jgi:methylmalonyl-CoA mutase N-terminal domain/subunit